MPEKDTLDALLHEGDPVSELTDTASSRERYNRLLPRLAEEQTQPMPTRRVRVAWLAIPALTAVALVTLRCLQPPAVPPIVERVAILPTPMPLPTAGPALPLTAKKDTVARSNSGRQPRTPRRHYRRRERTTKTPHLKWQLKQRLRRPASPVETDRVERIVIERSVVPASRVAIVISGTGEAINATRTVQEEKW